VLERLTPEQRVAFVLHDVMGFPFAHVAAVLDTTEAAARQHASRGRRAVRAARPARPVPLAQQQAAVAAFVAAAAGGGRGAVVRFPAPAVVLTSDGGGKARAALRPVVGADAVARLLLGLVSQGVAGRGGAGGAGAARVDVARVPSGRGGVPHVDVVGPLGR